MMNRCVTINDLNDDCLLTIFNKLPLRDKLRLNTVCRKWRDVLRDVNLFASEICLGTWKKSDFCSETGHQVTEINCIAYLFSPLDRQLCEKTFKGKYDISKDVLKELLTKFVNVRSLVLKFARLTDIEMLDVIANGCPRLEHLDLSHTWTKPEVLYRLNSFIASLGSNIRHLNLLGFDKINENQLRVFMYGCPNVEELVIGIGSDSHLSISDQPSKGQFLSMVGEKIKRVHIYFKYDDASCIKENNFGENSLNALAKGPGKNIEELKINGVLSSNWINIIVKNFSKLEKLIIGGFFIDLRSEGHYQEIGAVISKIKSLRHLSIRFPVNISFEVGLLDFIRGRPELLSLEVFVTPVTDSLIVQLPHYCPNLQKLCLYYMPNSGPNHQLLPTDTCLPFVAKFSNIRHLAMHSCDLTDAALVDVVKHCQSLRVLDVRNCRLVTNNLLHGCIEHLVASGSSIHVYCQGTDIKHVMPPMGNLKLHHNFMCYIDEEGLAYNCDGLSVPNLHDE